MNSSAIIQSTEQLVNKGHSVNFSASNITRSSIVTPRNECRSYFDILADHHGELSAIAADVSINWQAVVEQISIFPFKLTAGIALDSKYRGKVVCYGKLYRTKNGNEYPTITFHTNKHGGVTETWSGYEAEHRDDTFCSRTKKTFIPPRVSSHKVIKNKAQDIWRQQRFEKTKALFESLAPETGSHVYLQNKFKLDAATVAALTDLRCGTDKNGDFIIFAAHCDGMPSGFQKIYHQNIKNRKTNKDFIFGQHGKNGSYHEIKGNDDIIYIVEGLSTGLSIALATSHTVIVAFDAGNLIHVAAQFTGQNAIIAADNDIGKNGNTGVLKAIEAGKKYAIKVVAPDTETKADYNDILLSSGIDGVLEHLQHKITIKPSRFEYECQRLPLLPLNQKKKAAFRAAHAGVALIPFTYNDVEEVIEVIRQHYPADMKPIVSHTMNIIEKRKQSINGFMSLHDEEIMSLDKVKRDEDLLLNTGGFYLDTGGVGSGKTTFMCAIASQAERNNRTTTYITHRVSLINSTAEIFNAGHYQQVKSHEVNVEQIMAMCINSTLKGHLQAFLKCSDVLLLDELRQLLEAIAMGTIPNNEREQILTLMRDCIENTPLVICSDADIDAKTFAFLKSCHREISLIDRDDYVAPNKTLIHTGYAHAEALIQDSILNGEKVLIMTDSIKHSEMLAQKCDQANISYLLINKDVRDNTLQTEFLTHPNIDRGYQVVISTPVITSGFSIENSDLFDKVYLLSCGVLPMNEILQSAGRYRPATEVIAGFKNWSDRSMDERTHRETLASISKLRTFDHWEQRCQEDIANARSYGVSGVLVAFELKGWTLKSIKSTRKADNTAASAAAEKVHHDKITQADDISDEKADSIHRQYKKTEQDHSQLEKYQIKKILNIVDINTADLMFWNRGKGAVNVHNFSIAMMSSDEVKALDKKEADSDLAVTLRSHNEVKNRLYTALFKTVLKTEAVHIDSLVCNTTYLSALDCMTFLNHCAKDKYAVLAGIHITNINPTYAIRSVHIILQQLGLKVICEASNGKRKYLLCTESLERMLNANAASD